MSPKNSFKNQSGNTVIIVLVILVVAAIGALAYLSGYMTSDKGGNAEAENTQVAEAQSPAAGTEAQTEEENVADAEAPAALPEIKEGNPTVAKVNGQEIKRQDVLNFIQNLPPQTRQDPLKIFPLAQDQVINNKIIEEKVKSVNLDDDPEVVKRLALAKEQILSIVYIQNEVSKKLTDERMKAAYDEFIKTLPKGEEVKAAHILVEDEETAREVVKKLIETGDFTALAKEYSKDATAENGGDLGYFLKGDVVPEFAEAAFSMEPGTYTKNPVKSEFGYHIIRVEDKRERKPPKLEEVRAFLEGQMRNQVLNEILQEWRAESDIERFDINGDVIIEPAAGEEAPEAPKAPSE